MIKITLIRYITHSIQYIFDTKSPIRAPLSYYHTVENIIFFLIIFFTINNYYWARLAH